MAQSVLEMAKELVMVQIETHRLTPDEMQQELQKTYATLMALQQQGETGAPRPVSERPPPRKPMRWQQSIRKHIVTCLECGQTFK